MKSFALSLALTCTLASSMFLSSCFMLNKSKEDSKQQFVSSVCLTDRLAQTEGMFLKNPRESGGKGVAHSDLLWKPGQTIRVKFVDKKGTEDTKLVRLIMETAKDWEGYANLKFKRVFSGPAEIRISLYQDPGAYWSLLGKSSLNATFVRKDGLYALKKFKETRSNSEIEQDISEGVSMNLGLPYALANDHFEYIDEIEGIVLHEFGHAIGLNHEHQHCDRNFDWNKNAIREFYRKRYPQWSEEQIEYQMNLQFTARYCEDEVENLETSPYDPESIMHYAFSKKFLVDDVTLTENYSLSRGDKDFIERLYPFDIEKPDTVCAWKAMLKCSDYYRETTNMSQSSIADHCMNNSPDVMVQFYEECMQNKN